METLTKGVSDGAQVGGYPTGRSDRALDDYFVIINEYMRRHLVRNCHAAKALHRSRDQIQGMRNGKIPRRWDVAWALIDHLGLDERRVVMAVHVAGDPMQYFDIYFDRVALTCHHFVQSVAKVTEDCYQIDMRMLIASLQEPMVEAYAKTVVEDLVSRLTNVHTRNLQQRQSVG